MARSTDNFVNAFDKLRAENGEDSIHARILYNLTNPRNSYVMHNKMKNLGSSRAPAFVFERTKMKFNKCLKRSFQTPFLMSSTESMGLQDNNVKGPDAHIQQNILPTQLTPSNSNEVAFEPGRSNVDYDRLPIAESLELFLWLRDYGRLQQEFQRVTQTNVNQFEELLMEKINEHMPHKPNCGYDCETKLSTYSFSISFLRSGEFDGKVKELICVNTNVRWMNLVKFAGPGQKDKLTFLAQNKRMGPIILVDQSIFPIENCASVYVDGEQVLNKLNFLQAFLASYYLHYVLNIKFVHKMIGKMWKVLDKVLGKVKAETKQNAK